MRHSHYVPPPDTWPGVSTALYAFDAAIRRWNAQPLEHYSTSTVSHFTLISRNLRLCGSDLKALDILRTTLWELRRRAAPLRPIPSTKPRTKTVRFAALAEECSPNLQHRTLVPVSADSTELPSRHRSPEPSGFEIEHRHPYVILLQGLTGEMLAYLLSSPWVQDDFLVTPGPQSQRSGGWPDRAYRGNITLVSHALLPCISGNPYVVTFLNSREGAHAVFLRLGDLVVVNAELESTTDSGDQQIHVEQMLCLGAHLRDAEEIPAILGGLGKRGCRSLVHAHDSQDWQLYELEGDCSGASGDKLLCSRALYSRVSQVRPILDDGDALGAGLAVTVHLNLE